MKIENSTILITGTSSGIGEATAIAAVEKDARVVLLARREDKIRGGNTSVQKSMKQHKQHIA